MSTALLNDLHFVQELVNRIEGNLAESIDIVKLAQSFRISPWHFQRLFKSWIGDTLGGYIRGRRLTKGAELLLTSDLSIIDIAFEVGFNSHEAFSRSFKSYFDQTPKQFRKKRPEVRLSDKPLLSVELMQHMAKEISREPLLFERPALHVMGMTCPIPSPFTQPETHCDTMYPTWMELLRRIEEVPNKRYDTFLGMSMSESGDFTEDELTFLAGIPLASYDPEVDTIPEGMTYFYFPAQYMASFDVAVLDSDTVSKTMDYIYGYWLPNSKYQRATGHDYEFFENVQHFQAPEMGSQYLLPVDLKA